MSALLLKQEMCIRDREYTAQAHNGLVQMYLADDRFLQYYNRNVNGCAEFLVAAVPVSYTHLDVYKRQQSKRIVHTFISIKKHNG